MTKQQIKKIILKHINNQNSFVDSKGKNHFNILIEELCQSIKDSKKKSAKSVK